VGIGAGAVTPATEPALAPALAPATEELPASGSAGGAKLPADESMFDPAPSPQPVIEGIKKSANATERRAAARNRKWSCIGFLQRTQRAARQTGGATQPRRATQARLPQA
jgi:hypothetical protein